MGHSSLLCEGGGLMLLVLVEMERMLDLVTKALTIGRLRVSSMLLLVDISSTATLNRRQY